MNQENSMIPIGNSELILDYQKSSFIREIAQQLGITSQKPQIYHDTLSMLPPGPLCKAFSPDGRFLALNIGSIHSHCLKVLKIPTNQWFEIKEKYSITSLTITKQNWLIINTDHSISIYDLETVKKIKLLEFTEKIGYSLTLSDDHQLFSIKSTQKGIVKVFALPQIQCVHTLRFNVVIPGYTHPVTISHHNSYLSVGCQEYSSEILLKVFDLKSGNCIAKLIHDNPMKMGPSIDFIIDETHNLLLSAVTISWDDRQFYLWNLRTGKCLKSWLIKNAKKTIFSYQSAVNLVEKSSKLWELLIFDFDTQQFNSLAENLIDVDISNTKITSNALLILVCENGLIQLFDLNSKQWKQKINHDLGYLRFADLSNDNQLMIAESWVKINIWDLQTGQILHKINKNVLRIDEFSKTNNGFILSFSKFKDPNPKTKQYYFKFLDLTQGIKNISFTIQQTQTGGVYQAPLIIPSCGYLVHCTGFSHGNPKPEDKLIIWDLYTQKLLYQINNPETHYLTISSDGNWLVTAVKTRGLSPLSEGRDKGLKFKLWHLGATCELITTRQYRWQNVQSINRSINIMKISPDCQTLAVGFEDNTIGIFNLSDLQLLNILIGHENNLDYNNHTMRFLHIWSLTFSPDSQYLYSGSGDRTIKQWDYRNLDYPCQEFNQDNYFDQNLINRNCVHTFRGHKEAVGKLAISSDGKWMASGGSDSIRIWNLETKQCQAILPEHQGDIRGIQFDSESKTLYSTSNDEGTAKIWSIPEGKLLATYYNLEEGFLWTTPPDKIAPNGYFWTDKPDLLSIYKSNNSNDSTVELLPMDNQERQEYIQLHNRKDLVIARINNNLELYKNKILAQQEKLKLHNQRVISQNMIAGLLPPN